MCKAQLWLVSPKTHLAFKLLVSKIDIALLCQEGTVGIMEAKIQASR